MNIQTPVEALKALDEAFRHAAEKLYEGDTEIRIFPEGLVYQAEHNGQKGAWVTAAVWVSDETMGFYDCPPDLL